MTDDPHGAVKALTIQPLLRPWTLQDWLVSHLSPHLRAGTDYRYFTAVGLLFRHLHPENSEECQSFLTAEKHRMEVSIDHLVTEWVERIDHNTIRRISSEAAAHGETLADMLDRLRASDWPDGELVALAIAREWLEAVVTLLRIRGEASALTRKLQELDHAVMRLLPNEKKTVHRDSPLLSSLRRQGRTCWWAEISGIPMPR